jgi:hypothetical protein
MSAQLLPAESQRRHWYVNDVAPFQIPFDVDTDWPVWALPKIDGATDRLGIVVRHSGVVSAIPDVRGVDDHELPDPCATAIAPPVVTYTIESLSGDHAGELPAVVTTLVVPPPTGFTSMLPPDVNASVVPSGDHAGCDPLANETVVVLQDETVQVKTDVPSEKASCVPSGDHVGWVPLTAGSNGTSLPPAVTSLITPPLTYAS